MSARRPKPTCSYEFAGAAADEVRKTVWGTRHDRNTWAGFCRYGNCDDIIDRAHLCASMFEQGEIKNPIPAEISEDGGASILFVNKQTVPLDGSVKEALAGNYCTGQATLIRNFFFGLMQSMADGVRRDGHARQIANFLTVYPVFKGEIDMDKGYDPAKNGVMIRARLLNEMDLDITDWTFEDVTPGKRSFKLDSVKAGAVMGEYKVGETGNLNGKNLPSTEAGEAIRVHWEVEGTDKSGDIPTAKLASDVGRADIAADALAELASDEYDGKTVVFTVRGNFSSAKINAKLKYAAPEPKAQTSDGVAKVWSVKDGESETELHANSNWTLVGTNLNRAEPEWRIDAAMVEVNGESCGLTFNGGPDSVVLDPGEIAALPAGEYEGGRLKLYMVKGPVDETVSETLDVALGKIVVG